MLSHVTGAKGLVGQEVCAAIAKLGDVHATDVDDMDVTNLDAVMSTMSARPPDVIVHLAGLKGNLPSRENPLKFFDVNTVGTVNLLEAARKLGTKRFIFFSSLTAHGPSEEEGDELSPLVPQHPYSGSKAASEQMVHAYANGFGLRSTIFRPNFIIGPMYPPTLYEDNLVYTFIQAIKNTGEIVLAGEGQFQREWMHPKDVASAVSLAVSTDLPGCETFIICGERVTMQDFAERIVKRIGSGVIKTNPSQGGFSIISTSAKAKRQMGWKPTVDLDTLLDSIWEEYQARHG